MLLSLALSALALGPQAPEASQRPQMVLAGLETPARTDLAERIAEARRRVAPPAASVPAASEQQRLATLFPERPSDGLGSSAQRLALGQHPLSGVQSDERLGSAGRRAALSNPLLPRKRARR